MKSHVVVMGVAGAGKSTVAQAIAARLGFAFVDGDDFHTAGAIEKMRGGVALDDDDRRPWLDEIGAWLADHPTGVVACSALRRNYRDQLRLAVPDLFFVYLTLEPEVARQRADARPHHFMPASLIASQFDALEPLGPDEHGVTVDGTRDIDAIVRAST